MNESQKDMKNLKEFTTFEAAFEAATETKESFAAFQTGRKIEIIKKYAIRFFVSSEKRMFYISQAPDGLRVLKELSVYSMIHNGGFSLVSDCKDFADLGITVSRSQAVAMCNMKNSTAIFTH